MGVRSAEERIPDSDTDDGAVVRCGGVWRYVALFDMV